MQSDVPPLPIACLTDNLLRLPRPSHSDHAKPTAVHSSKTTTSVSRNQSITSRVLFQSKKSRPAVNVSALNSPYKNSARLNPTDTAACNDKSLDKSAINQRVSSAKMHRIKQLQNQLADAHFHLNELSNENKLLKAIQKRQDAALKRYEGTNAELPRIINTHHEDLRVLQAKYKKLRTQYNHMSDTLKEKDNELHSLQAQNKKLLQLSKDRQLGEREKLQTQVFDLTHRISEQDETIQTLKRKLELETKYLKHQLHVEMVKHKDTQKELEEAQTRLQHLERLCEQRLKRSYQASQLTYYSRGRASVTSQSLTNLSDTQSVEHPFKLHSFRKIQSESTTNQSLPSLNGATSTPNNHLKRTNVDTVFTVTEALANLETSRSSFRLVSSPASQRPPPIISTSKSTAIKNSLIDASTREEQIVLKKTQDKLDVTKKTYELPKELKKQFEYDDQSIKDSRSNSNDSLSDNFSYASRSRSLHARLVNSASDAVRTNKAPISSRSRSLTKENLENIVENEREAKYDRDSVITVISKEVPIKDDLDNNTNGSNSDIESEMDIPVAYTADEDDNARRKSDVIIDDVEIHKQSNTSSHLSSLFTHLRKPPNFSFGSKKNEEKTELSNKKEINGLTISNNKEIIDNAEESLNSTSKNIAKATWDDDLSEKDKNIKSNDVDSSFGSDQVTRDRYNDDIASSAEKLLDDITENLKETKPLENIIPDTSISNNVVQSKTNMNSKNSLEKKTEMNEATSKLFDKAKLLAAMKAIDDNENIEFVEQKPTRKNSATNRLQITENLYRGVPTHKKKSELMKELFSDNNKDAN